MTIQLKDLAKQENLHTRFVIEAAKKVGVDGAFTLSELTDEQVVSIKKQLSKAKATAKKKEAKRSATTATKSTTSSSAQPRPKPVARAAAEEPPTSGESTPAKPRRRRRRKVEEESTLQSVATAPLQPDRTDGQQHTPPITAEESAHEDLPLAHKEVETVPEAATATITATALVPSAAEGSQDGKKAEKKSEKAKTTLESEGAAVAQKQGHQESDTPQKKLEPSPEQQKEVVPKRSLKQQLKSAEALNEQKEAVSHKPKRHKKPLDDDSGFQPVKRPLRLLKPHRNKKSNTAALKKKKSQHHFNPRKRSIKIGSSVVVSELASLIGIKINAILEMLESLEIRSTAQESISSDVAQLVADEFSIKLEIDDSTLEDRVLRSAPVPVELVSRPPVVTVMGHVDHGKTSILDYIRKASIADGEAGGITQHIGAYYVSVESGAVCFLDTPGHEAFTAMRARGVNATDIVVLVVAADDGAKQQTIEAIDHAQAAGVPIIVAINKCDKDEANPDRVMQDLMAHNLIAEKYGGDCTMVEVSAKTGQGIDSLLELIVLQAETMELRSNKAAPSSGIVIEARLDRKKGNLATLLVQTGILETGQFLVAGNEYGKIRALSDDKGKNIKKALASMPVEVLGLNNLPLAGDLYNVVDTEKSARQLSLERAAEARAQLLASNAPAKINLENFFAGKVQNEKSILNLIIKTDVSGTLEPIVVEVGKQGNDEVGTKVIHSGVGAISASDVDLAHASQAIILGFNVRPENQAVQKAQENGIEIRQYSVIHDLLDDVAKALTGMLSPTIREELQGKAEVLEVFTISKVGVIAGCRVLEGRIVKEDSYIRVIRDHTVIHTGQLQSLQRFQEPVKQVQAGFECGIGIRSYKNLQVGDILENYFVHEEAGSL